MTILNYKSLDGTISLDTSVRHVSFNGQGGSAEGATATVETAGEISRRITATRLVATGVFALALKKKKDDRELYLMIDGSTFSFVAQCNPKDGLQARQFASSINTASKGGHVAVGRSSGGKSKPKTWGEYTPTQKKLYLWMWGVIVLIFVAAAITHLS